MLKVGLKQNNKFQIINDYLYIYPKDYFCPKSYKTNEINITENTFCIHHFAGSWKKKSKIDFCKTEKEVLDLLVEEM